MTDVTNLRAITPKGERSKSKIIKAAMDAFREKSYEETTIQHICNLSGIAIGTFYHHFSSKQDLVAAIHDNMSASLAEYYRGMEKTSYSSVILKLINYQVDQYEHYGVELIKKMYISVYYSPKNTYSLQNYSFFTTIEDAFRQGQIAGQFPKEYPLSVLIESVISIFFLSATLWCNHHNTQVFRQDAVTKTEFFLRLVAPN